MTRMEPDGSITVVANRYRGQRLNRPNDVVVKSDGSIYFTAPGARLQIWTWTSPESIEFPQTWEILTC